MFHKSICSGLGNQGAKRTETLLPSQGAHWETDMRMNQFKAKVEKYIECYGGTMGVTDSARDHLRKLLSGDGFSKWCGKMVKCGRYRKIKAILRKRNYFLK